MNDRQKLRKQLRQRRQSLSQPQQQAASRQLCKLLRGKLFFLKAKHIALYLPNDGEIDPTEILKLSLKLGKSCYLPVLSRTKKNTLEFLPYNKNTRLIKNRYGIPEPRCPRHHKINPKQLDLVLMPLVGFDANGGRMGMGGGYYDRTFAFCQKPTHQKPRLVGLAHHCQQVPKLELAHWDIPLDAITSDRQLIIPTQ